MYNLLVVDDEEIAIRGIVQGIDWSTLPFANIYTAYDAAEAREFYRTHTIHVMISDIDMPSENGIELLDWVNEHSPQTETIFLTGHADFRFAQQAIQLASFDYLLKPIDHDILKSCVERALENIQQREQEEGFRKTYEFYYEQWNLQLPTLIERFWQDVIHLRISTTADQLEPMYALYGLQLDRSKQIQPILISVEQWKQDWNARDEEIMTYALKNAASDIVLRDWPGHVIQDQGGMLYILLYGPSATDRSELEARCREYIRKCSELLYSVVSCYVGEPVLPIGLRAGVGLLTEMERSNVRCTGSVFRERDYEPPNGLAVSMPNLQDWALLVEQGKQTELLDRIEETFARLDKEKIDHTYMVNFYFGLVHEVFQALHRKSMKPSDVYAQGEWKDGEQGMRSLAAMKAWTSAFLLKGLKAIGGQGREVSNTIAKVQHFIEANLHVDLNREAIAEHVYLNPAYLSRLFRKETGQSLTDYSVNLRMERAKHELEMTNVKISDIAVSVGYSNFSHFSKLFKKTTGLTPLEYRKKHQKII